MEAGFDYKSVLRIIRRRALPFFAVFVVSVGIGAAAIFSLPAIYLSSATILVESQQIPRDLVRSIVTSQAEQRIQVIEQRLKARSNILNIVDKFNLYANERNELSVSDVVDRVRQRISIGRILLRGGRPANQPTIAFTVSFEDEDARTTALVANELVTIILEENARARKSSATETREFLAREASIRERDLVQLEADITRFKGENKESLPESFEFRLASLERLQRRLTDIDSELRSIKRERQLFEIRQAMGTGSTEITPRMRLTRQVNQLESELLQKAAVYSERHPAIRGLKQQISNVRDQLTVEIEREEQREAESEGTEEEVLSTPAADGSVLPTLASIRMSDFEDGRERLEAERGEIEGRIEDLQRSIEATPQTQLALNALHRQYALAQTQYQELTSKRAQAELGETLEEDQRAERFEVIEQPVVPVEPIRPNRGKLMTFAVLSAGALSGGLALALETIDTSIRSSEHLTSAFNRRPIVTIPYIPDALRKRKRMAYLLIFLLLIVILLIFGALAIIHNFYMPLDIFYFKLLSKVPF